MKNARLNDIFRIPAFGNLRTMSPLEGYSRRKIAIVIGLSLLVTLFEGVGLVLLYPLLEFLQKGVLDVNSFGVPAFKYLAGYLESLGVHITPVGMVFSIAALLLLRQLANFYTISLKAAFQAAAVCHHQRNLIAAMQSVELSFMERERSGHIVSLLVNESRRAAILTAAVLSMATGALKCLGYVVVLLFVSWEAVLVAGVLLAFSIYLTNLLTILRSQRGGSELSRANSALAHGIGQYVSLFRLGKLYGSGSSLDGDLYRRIGTIEALQSRIAKYAAVAQSVVEPIVLMCCIGLAFVAIIRWNVEFSAIALFVVALMRLVPIAQQVATDRQLMASAIAGVQAIDRFLHEARSTVEADAGSKPFPGLGDSLRFVAVSFAYPSGDEAGEPVPALHGIDLEIPAGKTTALLGPSGAGKSTLIDLIPRLRTPTSGQILFDGVPAEDIRLSDLRAAIAMVSQDTLIIDGTVSENLRYGQPEATEEQIIEAARAAFADGFIRDLPKGYDTVVGERGVLMSGGQKQRIALARALLARVPILLLDEPTSALDAESEQAVQRALETLQAGNDVTIIIIAHRLSTVRHADQIVVLEHGRLLGTGTHDALIRSAAWYRKIVELQTGERLPAADSAAPAVAGARSA